MAWIHVYTVSELIGTREVAIPFKYIINKGTPRGNAASNKSGALADRTLPSNHGWERGGFKL